MRHRRLVITLVATATLLFLVLATADPAGASGSTGTTISCAALKVWHDATPDQQAAFTDARFVWLVLVPIYESIGVQLPPSRASVTTLGTPVTRRDLRPGDLVFFGTKTHHLGVYLGRRNVISGTTGLKVVTFASLARGGRRILPAPAPWRAIGAETAVIAHWYLGDPYVWGAAGPDRFDSSGLTMYAYAQLGIPLPHNATMQYGYGARVLRRTSDPVTWSSSVHRRGRSITSASTSATRR